MSDQLECEIGTALAGEAVVVSVRGEVDLATASELETYVNDASKLNDIQKTWQAANCDKKRLTW